MTASAPADRRVYVVDDDAAVRRALSGLLRAADLEVETFANPLVFLDAAPALPRGGCLLLDVRMPGMDGLELQARLAQLEIALPVIIMTGQADVPTAVRAMKAGAFEFLEKPFDDEQLLEAVNAAFELRYPQDRNQQAIEATRRLAALSPREKEVLDGLVAGQQNKVIAAHLGISVRTVEGHRVRMLERLGIQRLAEAIRLAVMASLAPSADKRKR
jgi:two-component system, LuxR family, response regulator FixJ